MLTLNRQQIDALVMQLDQNEQRIRSQAGIGSPSRLQLNSREAKDVGDIAETESEELVVDAMLDHLRQELADIAAARRRMADGTYGICTECGQPVPLPRLRAYPTARRCTPCQEQYERLHPRR
jgi:RNA polymerase-binding protein DksA